MKKRNLLTMFAICIMVSQSFVNTAYAQSLTKENLTEIESYNSKIKRIEELQKRKTDIENVYKGIMERAQESVLYENTPIPEIKEIILNRYTFEELEKLNESIDNINKDKSITIFPFNSIIKTGSIIRFDTPPVIKDNRTLLPIRSVTETTMAETYWDEELREVKIVKGGKIILLRIGSTVAFIDGEEVVIDTTAEIINNRTYVPIRFIAETFDIKVEWDEEHRFIRLNDEYKDSLEELEYVRDEMHKINEELANIK